MGSPRRVVGQPNPDRMIRLRRDAALERIGSVTRTIAVASVVAAGAFGLYFSRAVPGHSTTTPAGGVVGSTTGGQVPAGGTSSAQSSAGLSTPNSPPAASQQPAPVISGSS